MRIGDILKENQPDIHKQLNNNNSRKRNKKKKRRKQGEHLSFHNIESMMKHDSYNRGPRGSIRQRTWSD